MRILRAAAKVVLMLLMLGIVVRLILSISAVVTVLGGQPGLISYMIGRCVVDLLLLALAVWVSRRLAARNKKEAVP